MSQTNNIESQIQQNLIGYFSFDETLTNLIQPTQTATVKLVGEAGGVGNSQFVPRWGERHSLFIPNGSCVSFPGLHSTPASQEQTHYYSLSLWVKLPIMASGEFYLAFWDLNGFVVMMRSDLSIQVGWGSEEWVLPNVIYAPDRWHNITLSYVGGTNAPPEEHKVITWLDGKRVLERVLRFDIEGGQKIPFQDSFTSIGDRSTAKNGATVCNYMMFTMPLTDELAFYLACDLFYPNSTSLPNIEYITLSLDGQGAVTCSDHPSLDLSSASNGITVSGWVYNDLLDLDIDQHPTLFERAGNYLLGIDNAGYLLGTVYTSDGKTVSAISSIPVPTSEWVYISMSLTKNSINLFINGEKVLEEEVKFTPIQTSIPQATLTIGHDWSGNICTVEIYSCAMTNDELRVALSSKVSRASLPANLLFYYDFSVSPPAVYSPISESVQVPQLPGTARYEICSCGLALGCNAYVDGGSMPDTGLSLDNNLITLEAWINISLTTGIRTIAGRYRNGRGYCLYIQEGKLCFDICDQNGISGSVSSTFVLPTDRWIQVGFSAEYKAPNAIFIELFVNGQAIADSEVQLSSDKSAFPIEEADVPFMIGARLMRNPGATGTLSPTVPIDGFIGFIGQLTIYSNYITPSYLYHQPLPDGGSVEKWAEWLFDSDTPTDTVGRHPTTSQNCASIDICRQLVTPQEVIHLTNVKDDRFNRWRDRRITSLPDLYNHIPNVHQNLLATTPQLLNCINVHTIDSRCYLIAHPKSLSERPKCLLISEAGDTTALWIHLALDIVVLGVSVWGLRSPSSEKLGEVGVSIWKNGAIRDAFFKLVEGSISEVPLAFVTLMQVFWNEGFISELLACFDISFFTVLRIASFFAPWVGIGLLLADLARVATEIYDRIQRQDEKLRPPDPGIIATPQKQPDLTGAIPVTVNSDATIVRVALTAPPRGSVTVNASPSILQCNPVSLNFTPINWSIPQEVSVRIEADDDLKIADGTAAVVTWSGDGVAGTAEIFFRIRVADIVCTPSEVQLKRNDQTGEYEGSFDVSITAEIASDAPVHITFQTNCSQDPNVLEFDPPNLTFTNLSWEAKTRLGSGRQTVKAKRKASSLAPNTVPVCANGQSAPRRPVSKRQCRIDVRKKPITEEVTMTMVSAGKGNCYIVSNTAIEDGKAARSQCAIIDGGMPKTKDKMLPFLPPNKKIDYVFCTHYDEDHIAGLIELMEDPQYDVQKVIFNPPPDNALDGILMAFSLLNDIPNGIPNILKSVKQGHDLKRLAGEKLIQANANGFSPPPEYKKDGITLPTLDIKFAGPTTENYNKMLAHPTERVPINRASLIFLIESNVSETGFKMLITGDGYNCCPNRLDVTGAMDIPKPVHFLQVPHHGSKNNSDQSLYLAFPAEHYLISTKYTAHHHPSPEVIYCIVSANRVQGRMGYSIWITDPDLPEDYEFPPLKETNEYFVYTMKKDAKGGCFKFVDGNVQPDSTAFEKFKLPSKNL